MPPIDTKEEYPPNYDFIKDFFDFTDSKPIFCYGNTIYNPHKIEVYPDLIYHERIHQNQQSEYTSPDIWWTKYCMDKDFRLQEEIEAYAHQYLFLKKNVPVKVYEAILEEIGDQLSGTLYDLGVTKHTAQAMVKRKAKEITLFML